MAGTGEILLTAFAGAVMGSFGAGIVGFTVNRATQTRAGRVHIYVDVLHVLHDPQHDIVCAVRDDNNLKGQDPQLGTSYSDLMRAATAASAADVRRLRPWHDAWNDLGDEWGAFLYELRRLKEAEGRAFDRSAFLVEQQPALLACWERLDRVLYDYDDWLSWKLRRRWWWFRPIARLGKRVRRFVNR